MDQNTSDEWLMGEVSRGSQQQLEVLVRRYASPLLTYLERMMGDRHEAEELFQEVFLAVWTKRRTYQFPRKFRPWLFAIATNRCRQAFRRARAWPAATLSDVELSGLFTAERTPTEAAVATETAALVAAAVAQLPTQQRTVLVLRNWNGMSYGEIAQVTGRDEATARSHMHHALTSIRRYLETRLDSDVV